MSNEAREIELVCGIDDIPVISSTEMQKSETVTEWDVPDGVYMTTINPETNEIVYAPITQVSKHTNLKMYNVTTSVSGNWTDVAVVSEDHSLIAYTKEGKLSKVKPQEVAGMLLPRIMLDKANDNENCTKYMTLDKQVHMSYNLGIFIGAMVGDGWVDNHNMIRIAADKPEVRAALLKIMRDDNLGLPYFNDKQAEEFCYPSKDRFTDKDAHRITMYSTLQARKDLKALIGTGAENKRIPAICLTGSRAHMIGILIGLLMTDGTITYNATPAKGKKTAVKTISYSTCSVQLKDSLQEMMRRLGVRTSSTVYRGVNSTMDCYSITFSLTDMAKLYHERSDFRIPAPSMQAKLEAIVNDIDNSARMDYLDIVPFPEHLDCEMRMSGATNDYFGTPYANIRKRGYLPRQQAQEALKYLMNVDFNNCKKPYKNCYVERSVKERETLVNEWGELINNTKIKWVIVDKVEESTCTEGWDMTVPGPYTFTLSNGTIVQDTMNYHVPVSQQAVKESYEKMLPSRNLLSPSNMRAHYKPVGEFAQGLYFGSRINNKKKPVRFNTLAEAQDALKKGLIKWDDPIDIPDAEAKKVLDKED